MTTADHLNKILAKCHELLAKAEKRTPGKWDNEGHTWIYAMVPNGRPNGEGIGTMRGEKHHGMSREQDTANAAFIAACAGAAEAGWKSTMAMCEWLIDEIAEYGEQDRLAALANSIIGAWRVSLDSNPIPL